MKQTDQIPSAGPLTNEEREAVNKVFFKILSWFICFNVQWLFKFLNLSSICSFIVGHMWTHTVVFTGQQDPTHTHTHWHTDTQRDTCPNRRSDSGCRLCTFYASLLRLPFKFSFYLVPRTPFQFMQMKRTNFDVFPFEPPSKVGEVTLFKFNNSLNFNWILFYFIPFDSSLNVLSKVFWVRVDRTKRSVANSR